MQHNDTHTKFPELTRPIKRAEFVAALQHDEWLYHLTEELTIEQLEKVRDTIITIYKKMPEYKKREAAERRLAEVFNTPDKKEPSGWDDFYEAARKADLTEKDFSF
tara:strand:- start:31 stop:348 length:318 start_codon:yes stop_codon:yes gene_type:complete